jgi:hypothetical protein
MYELKYLCNPERQRPTCVSHAECSSYTAFINKLDPPEISEIFQQYIDKFPIIYGLESAKHTLGNIMCDLYAFMPVALTLYILLQCIFIYLEIIRQFGTHVITKGGSLSTFVYDLCEF